MGNKRFSQGRHENKGGRKRSFQGNQHTAEADINFVSTSAEKLKDNSDFEVSHDISFKYVLISFALVFGALESALKCKLCNSDIKFLKHSPRGLGFKLCVKCSCREYLIDSCPMIKNAYEINRRFTYVMRLLGVGHAGINLFCSLMDLNIFHKSLYYQVVEQISVAVKAVTDVVFQKAIKEENEKNVREGHPENHLTVSGDGSWAKRGYSSLLGIVSLIGKFSNKIVDAIVKSSICKGCQYLATKDPIEAESLYDDHTDECTANHEGSSGKMEVNGISEMFKRSVQRYGVKYVRYIGDGDSKTHKNLIDDKPYNGDPEVEKQECVLHVKKRMYRALQGVKKTLKEYTKAKKQLEAAEKKKKAAEEISTVESAPKKRRTKRDSSTSAEPPKPKPLQLTNKLMLKMSTYYGLAITRNCQSLEEMKRAVWATFYHMTSTDENPQHFYCPDSWCKYQQLKAENQESTYEHPVTFDEQVINLIKPVYETLASDDLLKRCLGGNTQNNNESFNHCVWNFAPKHTFTGKNVLEIATYTAACIFNEGFLPVLKVMEVMGVTIGQTARDYADTVDNARILRAEKTTEANCKEARTLRRALKAAENDKFEETEGLLYAPGIAD